MSGKQVAFDAAICATEQIAPITSDLAPTVFTILADSSPDSAQRQLHALEGMGIAHAADAIICLVQRFATEALMAKQVQRPMAMRGARPADPDLRDVERRRLSSFEGHPMRAHIAGKSRHLMGWVKDDVDRRDFYFSPRPSDVPLPPIISMRQWASDMNDQTRALARPKARRTGGSCSPSRTGASASSSRGCGCTRARGKPRGRR